MLYPLLLDLQDRPVLVVGGGPVAERKIESLMDAGAAVTVVAPELTDALHRLAEADSIRLFRRSFQENDLQGMFLVISATDSAETQELVARLARDKGVLLNTVDQPHLCDFILPAIVRRDDLVVAISTSGKSPALAAALRRKLEGIVGDNWARTARILGEVRAEVQQRYPDANRRKAVFEQVLDSGVLDWIGECDDEDALKRVRDIIGSTT